MGDLFGSSGGGLIKVVRSDIVTEGLLNSSYITGYIEKLCLRGLSIVFRVRIDHIRVSYLVKATLEIWRYYVDTGELPSLWFMPTPSHGPKLPRFGRFGTRATLEPMSLRTLLRVSTLILRTTIDMCNK